MSPPAAAFSGDRWPAFLEDYRRRVPSDPLGIAAFQLFTNLRDATPALWLKEALKALHFFRLSSSGSDLLKLPLKPSYDYCFIIDGTAAPGLTTSLPVLRALPAGRRALLVVRDHVLHDLRLTDLLRSAAFDVVNIDRTRSSLRHLSRLPREMADMVRAFPRGLATAPKLVHRKVHFEHILDALLDRVAVGCLVVTNERLILPCAAIHGARRRGISTVCLQHGALVDPYLPVIVDTYLTWGETSSAWFRERSVRARLCAIGAPRADQLTQYLTPSTPKPKDEGKVVAFFSQPPGADVDPERSYHVEREFLKLLHAPGVTLRVKLHPSDDPARWEEFSRAEPRKLRLLTSGDPYQVIAEADYVGAFYSTVLLEAMLFDKPVFQLNPFDDMPDYSRRSGCSPVRDGTELRQWIERCESDPSFREGVLARQRDFAREYFANVGSASRAFYECLDAIPAGRPTLRPALEAHRST